MDNNHIDSSRRWVRLNKEEFEEVLTTIKETKVKDLTFIGNSLNETLDYNDFSNGKKWPESCVMKVDLDADSQATKIYMIRADFLKEVILLVDKARKNDTNISNQ